MTAQIWSAFVFLYIVSVYTRAWTEFGPAEMQYNVTWDDLNKRLLPQWYDKAKIGVMVHWGIYSVPSFSDENFWYKWQHNSKAVTSFMTKYYPKTFRYPNFTKMFTAELFDADEWTKLFYRSGAKYVILTSKYFDGFALFNSNYTSWNSYNVGPKVDYVKVLSQSVRKFNLKFGVYYALTEWFNGWFINDLKNGFNKTGYVTQKLLPEFRQLVIDYKPSVVWADVKQGSAEYLRSLDLVAWLYRDSPVADEVVTNDKWSINGTSCAVGDFYTCKYNTSSNITHKWENAFSLDNSSWCFRRKMSLENVMTIKTLISTVVTTVSQGGNVLINVGATKEGTIRLIFQERLLQLGEWLAINGKAIYNTSPWFHQRDSLNEDVWYTCRRERYYDRNPVSKPSETDKIVNVYAIFLAWPEKNLLTIKDMVPYVIKNKYGIRLGNRTLEYWIVEDTMQINLTKINNARGRYGWTVEFG